VARIRELVNPQNTIATPESFFCDVGTYESRNSRYNNVLHFNNPT